MITTPFISVIAASPPTINAGCTIRTYAIVIKVVIPAIVSVLKLVFLSSNLKNDAILFNIVFLPTNKKPVNTIP